MRDYFAQMTGVFGASKEFQRIETPPELAELLTDFEREFRARGIQTLRAAYRDAGTEFQTSMTGPSSLSGFSAAVAGGAKK